MLTPKPVSLLWPFLLGFLLLVMVLGIVAFGDNPSPLQFTVYRIIVAIAGAGFAVVLTGTLHVRFPILGKGYIKAAQAFGVFVILYFFSPASLAVDGGAVEAKRLIDGYYSQDEEIVKARDALGANWELEKDGSKQASDANQTNQEKLEKWRDRMRDSFKQEGMAEAFSKVTAYHSRVFDCADNGSCDHSITCRELFREIEGFRNLFCDRLIELSDAFKEQLWGRYRAFSEKTCKNEFLAYYVRYENIADLKNVCLPVQCWARNTEPPYPCQIRRQLVGGVLTPG